jgi:hypothetical protein
MGVEKEGGKEEEGEQVMRIHLAEGKEKKKRKQKGSTKTLRAWEKIPTLPENYVQMELHLPPLWYSSGGDCIGGRGRKERMDGREEMRVDRRMERGG